MGIFLDHINVVLSKLRVDPITSLSTDTTSEAFKAQVAVRRAVWRVWNAKQWSFKLRQYSFSLTSGTNAYYLSKVIAEPTIILVNASPYVVTGITGEMMDRLVPNPTETGVPRFVKLYDMGGTLAAPSSGVLSISSSSASDTTQTVCVKGALSNGEVGVEEIALSGTSTVTTSTSFTSPIYSISKSGDTEGTVTIMSGATTIARLGPQEKTIRYRLIQFHPIPDSTYTATIKGFGMPPLLTKAYEDIEIPSRWDYVVDQWAFAMALQGKGQEQLQEQAAEFQLAKSFLEDDMNSEEQISSDILIVPQKWGSDHSDIYFPQLSGYGITYP